MIHRLWLIIASSIASSLTLTGLVVLFQIFSQKTMASSAQPTQSQHPTALPWIKTESDCVGKTRRWKENLCFEANHDPMF